MPPGSGAHAPRGPVSLTQRATLPRSGDGAPREAGRLVSTPAQKRAPVTPLHHGNGGDRAPRSHLPARRPKPGCAAQLHAARGSSSHPSDCPWGPRRDRGRWDRT